MDSITQMALGAAVGEATLGRKLGNRALLIGAALGTLPDLDVLVPFGNAVADFTYHPQLFALDRDSDPDHATAGLAGYRLCARQHGVRWFWCVFLVLNTHVLLDCFTVYGTQALWPLSDFPVAWATIFIIDPLYTLPLITGLIVAMRSTGLRRRRIANTVGLMLSSAYLAWTVIAHQQAQGIAFRTLQQSSYTYQSLLTVPVPFSLLWRSVARGQTDYAEGYYSLLDDEPNAGQPLMSFAVYDSQQSLFSELESHWPVQRLAWFTKGFYTMGKEQDAIVMTDLRMGIEASYVFNFKVGEVSADGIKPVSSELRRFAPDTTRIGAVFQRMFDTTVSLEPDTPAKSRPAATSD